MPRRGEWGTRQHMKLAAVVLARDWDPDLGYTPCHWCGQRATTADHWPVGRDEGGTDTLDNLVPACRLQVPVTRPVGPATSRRSAQRPASRPVNGERDTPTVTGHEHYVTVCKASLRH